MARKRELIPDVEIVGMAHKGQAVGRTPEGLVVFVTGAVPGDLTEVRLLRKRKGAWQGVVEKVVKYSELRTAPKCQHFGICGGCKWQHLDYTAQLAEKEQNVRDSMSRIGGLKDINVAPIIGSSEIYQYRNKLEYSFSAKRWRTREEIESDATFGNDGALGLHPPGNFQKVVQLEKCWLQADFSNEIRNFVGAFARQHGYPFYDPLAHTGFLRNMIVRNTQSGQWMIIISFAHEDEDRRMALLDAIVEKFPSITSLHFVINQKKNDTLFDQEIIRYHGEPVIMESLGSLQFQIRPKSFFQTNTRQAKILYDQVRNQAEIKSSDTVFDLYCGLGSITLYLADLCREIIGIEEVADAVSDARLNAQLNGITNATFYAGDVRQVFSKDGAQKLTAPHVIITDPPRGGMHEDVVRKILELSPRQVVYVSCNPATQARDIKLLSTHYRVEKMQPVDMFPHTAHIENIASLRRK